LKKNFEGKHRPGEDHKVTGHWLGRLKGEEQRRFSGGEKCCVGPGEKKTRNISTTWNLGEGGQKVEAALRNKNTSS